MVLKHFGFYQGDASEVPERLHPSVSKESLSKIQSPGCGHLWVAFPEHSALRMPYTMSQAGWLKEHFVEQAILLSSAINF